MHISVAVIAAGLGNKLTADREAPDLSNVQIAGPSIADLRAIAQPEGGDTTAASMKIMAAMESRGR